MLTGEKQEIKLKSEGVVNKDKIRWACRRGMLELDKILLQFFDNEYNSLSIEFQIYFSQLLDNEDQDLFKWLILGDDLPDNPKWQDLVMVIRYFGSV